MKKSKKLNCKFDTGDFIVYNGNVWKVDIYYPNINKIKITRNISQTSCISDFISVREINRLEGVN